MDEAVRLGLSRWPAVPQVYGWLELDRRGQWRIKGDIVRHGPLAAFIGRNYEADAEGRWYFQNGPQRAYCSLQYTPLILRASLQAGALNLLIHTGAPVRQLNSAHLDDEGNLLLVCDAGCALVHDADLPLVLEHVLDAAGRPADLEALARLPNCDPGCAPPYDERPRLSAGGRLLPIEPIKRAAVPGRFGFNPAPRASPGQPDC